MAAARTRSRFDREDTRPRNDVYTGLLAISLVAMIVSCVLLWMDYSQYGATKAPPVSLPPPATPKVPMQGQLPPPPPLEERPGLTRADTPPAPLALPEPAPAPVVAAPAPIQPVVATETPAPPPPAIVGPAVAEVPPAPAPAPVAELPAPT